MTDEVYTVIVISTGHVTKETAELLNVEAANCLEPDKLSTFMPMTLPWSTYGWLVYAEAEPAAHETPADLQACMSYAMERGHSYLRFDCDGDQVDGLPFFDNW